MLRATGTERLRRLRLLSAWRTRLSPVLCLAANIPKESANATSSSLLLLSVVNGSYHACSRSIFDGHAVCTGQRQPHSLQRRYLGNLVCPRWSVALAESDESFHRGAPIARRQCISVDVQRGPHPAFRQLQDRCDSHPSECAAFPFFGKSCRSLARKGVAHRTRGPLRASSNHLEGIASRGCQLHSAGDHHPRLTPATHARPDRSYRRDRARCLRFWPCERIARHCRKVVLGLLASLV